jgi:DnaJ family protein C protein 8
MADDVDKVLRLEENQFLKDQEVERIVALKGNQDPFLILEMPLECYVTLEIKDLKKVFRNKSRLLHPDKNPHPLAREAFDILQKAKTELEDPHKKRIVMDFIKDAREGLLHRQGIKVKDGDYHALLDKFPNLGRLIQLEFIRLQRELELRDRTRLKNELGRELMRQEQEKQEEAKREQFEKEWDESRQNRIKSWKKFETKSKVKKKSVLVLGEIPKAKKSKP